MWNSFTTALTQWNPCKRCDLGFPSKISKVTLRCLRKPGRLKLAASGRGAGVRVLGSSMRQVGRSADITHLHTWETFWHSWSPDPRHLPRLWRKARRRQEITKGHWIAQCAALVRFIMIDSGLLRQFSKHVFFPEAIFDMRLSQSHTSAAARPNLVAYFFFGVKSTHCSRFYANGQRTRKNLVVLYHCFMLAAKKFLSSTTVKKW